MARISSIVKGLEKLLREAHAPNMSDIGALRYGSSRQRPHLPYHTKGPLYRWDGEQCRDMAEPRTAIEHKKRRPQIRRKRHKGGKPAAEYRAARRNREFGRKPAGNTTRDDRIRILNGIAPQ